MHIQQKRQQTLRLDNEVMENKIKYRFQDNISDVVICSSCFLVQGNYKEKNNITNLNKYYIVSQK